YENFKNLAGINNLSEDDHVIIFYSQKANSLSFETLKEIQQSKAAIEYKLVDVGSQNALDFQLGSYLGYLIKQHENSDCKFFIVAKDKGYSFISSFWKKEKSIEIKLLNDLTGKAHTAVAKKPKSDTDIKKLLKQSNVGLNDNEINEISAIVSKYKTTQTINGYLNKLLKDSAKTGAILKIIKPHIKK
ncbi:MAG: hypothetical protein K2N22_03165, partial [Clostridia bacterium]|nr:hypothetical protein [Clostridia bacterium]